MTFSLFLVTLNLEFYVHFSNMNRNYINRYTSVSKIYILFRVPFSRNRIKYVDLSDFYSHNEMI